jgi:hypothetical protein
VALSSARFIAIARPLSAAALPSIPKTGNFFEVRGTVYLPPLSNVALSAEIMRLSRPDASHSQASTASNCLGAMHLLFKDMALPELKPRLHIKADSGPQEYCGLCLIGEE